MKIKRYINRFRHYRHKTFILAGLFVIIVAPTVFFILRNAKKTEAGWFNDGWNYRKSIPIANSGSALADFQVKLTLDTVALVTAKKLQTSCADLRFTNFSGVELPYWIESGCNTTTTTIWIKVDTIPAGGNTIYIYYGNPSAPPTSDGFRVFPFFDDFSSATLNPKWTANGTYTQTNGILSITLGNIYTSSYVLNSFDGYILESKRRWTNLTGGYAGINIGSAQNMDVGTAGNAVSYYMTEFSDSNTSIVAFASDGTGTTYNIVGGNTQYTQTINNWYIDGNSEYGGSLRYHSNRSTLNTYTGSLKETPLYINMGLFASNPTYNIKDMEVDWILIRRYTTSEPTAGTLGSEETGGGPILHYSFDEGTGTTAHNTIGKTPENGLVGYWKFNDASSGTSPAPGDETKINTTSFNGNAAYSSTSRVGYAVTFDGNGDYLTVTNNTALNLTTYTVSSWVNIDNLSNSSGHFAINRYSYSANQGYGIEIYNTGQAVCEHNGASGRLASAVNVITANSWYHIACVYDGALLSIIVNGNVVKSEARSPLSNYNSNAYIGTPADSVGNDAYSFSGKIDEVRIYNRALTPPEIASLYTSFDADLINSPTWSEGATPPNQKPLGASLTMDGNDSVNTPLSSSQHSSTAISFGTWIKSSNTGTQHILNKSKSTWISYLLYTAQNATCQIGYDSGTNVYSVTSTGTVTDGNWHHVMCTYDKSNLKIFIDGKLNNSVAGTSDIYFETSYDFRIGSHITSSDYFSGSVDETKIFNYALSADQVAKEYNRGIGSVLGVGTKSTDPGATNLKGWWRLDEPAGATIAQDSSGNNNYGTSTNGAGFAPGKIGHTGNFDGTDDTLAIANEANFDFERTNSFSISAWVKTSAAADQMIFSKMIQGAPYNGFEMGVNSTGKLRFIAINDTGTTNRMGGYGSTIVNDGNWHHVAVTYSGTSNMAGVIMYVDGLKQTITNEYDSLSASILTNYTPYIGSRYNTYGRFNGQIDDVRIYNKTLSSGEVSFLLSQGGPIINYSYDEATGTTIYNQADADPIIKPNYHWKFNEGTGTSVADEADKTTDTATDLSWTTGKIGSAGSFNGTSSYVSTGDLSASLPFSFSTWIYLPSTPTTWYTILTTDDFTTNYYGFWIQVDANQALSLNFGDGTVSGPTARRSGATANSSVPTGQWVHLAGVARGATDMSLYINGVSYSVTYTGSGGALATNSSTGLIGRGGNSTSYFNGYIDDLRLFNQALTVADVNNIYSSTAADLIGSPTWSDGIQKSSSEKSLGKALTFDGTSQYGLTNFAAGILKQGYETGSWSLSTWAKPNGSQAGSERILVGRNGCHSGILADTNTFSFQLKTNDSGSCWTGAKVITYTPPNMTDWYHLVATYDAGAMKFYANGTLVGSDTFSATFTPFDDFLWVGGFPNYGGFYFKGNLDETKIFPYALSATDVLSEYNRSAGVVLGAGINESDPKANTVENFTYKVPITVTNSSGSSINNAEVLVSLNTSTLISASKMQTDCDDLRFTSTDGVTVLNHWIEAGCNTTTTQIWVKIPILPTGDTTIYAYYGNSLAFNRELAWNGSFIVLSTVSCPTGWTRDANFDSKFPYGASSYGSSGGSDTHTGSETINTGAASSVAEYRPGSTWPFPSNAHTHTLSLTLGSGSVVPTYIDMIFCASPDLNLFTNSITAYTTTPSGTRSRFTTLDSKFPRGAASYTGSGGGSASHSHTYTGTSSSENGTTVLRDTGFGDYRPQTQSASGHTHSVTNSSTGSSTNLPPYLSTIFAQMGSTTVADANTITMATALPPLGWSHNTSYDSRFPYGASSYGTTGGAATHTHTLSAITTGGPSGTVGPVDGGAGSVGSSSHTHSTSATNTASHNSLPVYYATKYISRKASSGSASVGTETTGSSVVSRGSESLKGWWKLDEAAGSGIAQDSSGNNYSGTVSNAVFTPGIKGRAAYFDGTGDYITVGNLSAFGFSKTDTFSASGWVKTNSTSTAKVIVAKIGTGAPYNGWQMYLEANSGNLTVDFAGTAWATDWIRIRTSTNLADGAWHHVAFTNSGAGNAAGISIYVDGIKQTTTTVYDTLSGNITNSNNFYLGGNGSSLFTGHLDDIKVFNKTLTGAEIAYEYNQGKPSAHWSFDQKDGLIATNQMGTTPTTDGLVGLWTMDSTTINDMSGNGNNLTNSGSPTAATGVKAGAVDYLLSSSQYSYCADASCGPDLDYQGNGLTVSAWVIGDAAISTLSRAIMVKSYYNNSADNGGYSLRADANTGLYVFFLGNASGVTNMVNVSATTAMSTSYWQHVVGVYDGSTAKIYVNGKLEGTAAYTGGIKNVTQNFEIGGSAAGNYWDGKIDHVKVWQRPLSDNEVALEYSSNEKYGYLTNFPTDNSQWVTGKFGNALTFDGSNDSVDLGDNYDFAGSAFSVCTWAYPTSAVNNGYLVGKYDVTPAKGFWLRKEYNTEWSAGTESGLGIVSTGSLAVVNQWHHLCAVINPSPGTSTLYVNGQSAGTSTSVAATVDNTRSMTIGNRYDNGRPFLGKIDEVRFYPYALSANQVLVDYNNGAAVKF